MNADTDAGLDADADVDADADRDGDADATVDADGDWQVLDGDATTGTVQTNGIETHYVRRGDGPPIVFVHGMATSAAQWTPQQTALADDFTTVAYDVRGHGYTGGSECDPYTMDLYAADLHALLDALDVENPVLCGLSMGGCIAQVYAATHPENVAGLVLSDTFPAGPLPLGARLVFANLRVLGLLDRVVGYRTLNRVQTRVGDLLAPGIAGDRATAQRLVEAGPAMSHAEFRKVARSVADFPASGFDAAAIEAPALVLCGEHVPGVLRSLHQRVADQVAGGALTVVPAAGHASNVDNPEFFSTAVREFAVDVLATRNQ
jgi:pimeloyl-ACP methyl ester carboxylesterase